MRRWEYKQLAVSDFRYDENVLRLTDFTPTGSRTQGVDGNDEVPKAFDEKVYELGNSGWELTSIVANRNNAGSIVGRELWFKRPVEN